MKENVSGCFFLNTVYDFVSGWQQHRVNASFDRQKLYCRKIMHVWLCLTLHTTIVQCKLLLATIVWSTLPYHIVAKMYTCFILFYHFTRAVLPGFEKNNRVDIKQDYPVQNNQVIPISLLTLPNRHRVRFHDVLRYIAKNLVEIRKIPCSENCVTSA